MATSVIRIKKICAWCGKEFEAQKLSTQFCSHRCSSHAYKDKKRQEKKQRAETASQRSQQKKKVEDIKDKEYLTVSEAAQLLGFTRDGVYKLIYRGLLKAHRITSRWTVNYRKDIDEMITARPIDPSGISKKDREPITEFYTTKEVLEKFSISNSWLFKAAKQQNIPKVTQHGKTYWSKKHCDMIFGKKDTSVEEITEWYSVAEILEIFGMTLPAIYCLVSKTGIPKKKEGKEVRYSKNILMRQNRHCRFHSSAWQQCRAKLGGTISSSSILHHCRQLRRPFPKSWFPPDAQRLGTNPGIRHQPYTRRQSKSAHKPIHKRIRSQYTIGIRRKLSAFIQQSEGHNHRGKNRHEIVAYRSPQTRTAPARH